MQNNLQDINKCLYNTYLPGNFFPRLTERFRTWSSTMCRRTISLQHYFFVFPSYNLFPAYTCIVYFLLQSQNKHVNIINITFFHFLNYVKPRPKSQTPKAQPQPSQIQLKSVPKGLGLTLKSYGPPPPHPPTHPTTFNHEGGL